jgi:hypothetical protein
MKYAFPSKTVMRCWSLSMVMTTSAVAALAPARRRRIAKRVLTIIWPDNA